MRPALRPLASLWPTDEDTEVDAVVQIVDVPPPRPRRATLPYGANLSAGRVIVRVGG